VSVALFVADQRTFYGVRLAAYPRRSARRGLAGRLDAPARPRRTYTEAAQRIDQAGQGGTYCSVISAPSRRTQVVRRHHRNPHRRGRAVFGLRSGPMRTTFAGVSNVGAPRRRAGWRRDQDCHRGARRKERDHWRDFLLFSRIDLYRKRFHRIVSAPRRPAINGRVGSCFDNAASEALFSTLEHEVLSRHHFATKAQARAVVTAWS
jgi:hypothetical protein